MAPFPSLAMIGITASLASACAANRVPVYIAPSNQTVMAETEMSFSGDGQYIYVTNQSSVPIMVTGLQLVECENIKNRCEVQHLRTQIPPHQRTNLVLVKPDNTSKPYSFRFHFSWEPVHGQ